MKIDGHTRLAAVIAKPIKHSISPFIHNMAYELTDINAVYLAFEVEREGLAQAVDSMRLYQMMGANISMPYKQEVITYLEELDASAQLIGAVNTVVNQNVVSLVIIRTELVFSEAYLILMVVGKPCLFSVPVVLLQLL